MRSSRTLIEQLAYAPPFRWFVGFRLDDAAWRSTTVTNSRSIAQFKGVVGQARGCRLLSAEPLKVDERPPVEEPFCSRNMQPHREMQLLM